MVDDKKRAALEATDKWFSEHVSLQDDGAEVIRQVRDALKSEPESINTRLVEGLIRQAYDKGIASHLNNITVELMHLPEEIESQTLVLADQTTEVENQRLKVAELVGATVEEVANNPALKNDTMRKAERERLLKANSAYIEASKELRMKEQTLTVQRAHLEYLHNMFAAYRSIATMGAKA